MLGAEVDFETEVRRVFSSPRTSGACISDSEGAS